MSATFKEKLKMAVAEANSLKVGNLADVLDLYSWFFCCGIALSCVADDRQFPRCVCLESALRAMG